MRQEQADVEKLLRLIQSVPSPKAEPTKLWLAKVGYERIQEILNQKKALKHLKPHNLREYRSDTELVFTALTELSTQQIAETIQAKNIEGDETPAQKGKKIAKHARLELEAKTGKRVISSESYLPPVKKQRQIKQH